MLHFSFKCGKNWKEIERLSGVHHSNLSNNELFRSPLKKDSFNGVHTFWLVQVSTLFPQCFSSLFPISALKLNCRRSLNIFWKDVSAVVNVIVHSCKELISEATCSLGLPARPSCCTNSQDFSKSLWFQSMMFIVQFMGVRYSLWLEAPWSRWPRTPLPHVRVSLPLTL